MATPFGVAGDRGSPLVCTASVRLKAATEICDHIIAVNERRLKRLLAD
jgi:hypothetical protein